MMPRDLLAPILLLASCAPPATPSDVAAADPQALVVCPRGDTVPGIDVSHWQDTIDWDQVATTEARFAIVRVSHGTGVRDRQFERNWPEVRRVGLIRGVYQFFSAEDDPIAQADLLIDAIGGSYTQGDLPPVLDVEGMSLDGPPASVAVANMRAWLAHVEARLGVRPILYTARYFWRDELGDPDFSDYPL
ncbi:MAG: hypothetical protein K8H88_16775, partial [Sandaracinaceae bacterium]|nr:hypothetical protein [Sandaracinaceae bacterium]